jgi:UDP-N-acetyl-D-mannosaminuronic acid dehydrogenase
MVHPEFKKVSVIGLGYIGLPTAAIMASRGLQVVGVEVNQQAVDTINAGKIHIVEPDLDIVVRSAVTTGNLRATTQSEAAQAFMVAVPTPFKGDDHQPDLSYVEAAAKSIAPVLEKGNLVILESTSPVGATEKLAAWLKEARPDLSFPQDNGGVTDINIAHCPERVLPGYVLQELVSNDRVIGGMTPECSEKAVALYKTFVKGDCIVTNARTAEMAKLTENSCRDVQIAFANELSMICDQLDINVWELISLANRHPRINILQPGPGVGGHCIAVDPWFIINRTPELAPLIHTARSVNDSKPQWVIGQVEKQVARFLNDHPNKVKSDVTVACFGLAFKPDIDDLRESPALEITQQLSAHSEFKVVAIEPNAKKVDADITVVSLDVAFSIADIYVLLVDHKTFKQFKPACEYIVDTKGIWL